MWCWICAFECSRLDSELVVVPMCTETKWKNNHCSNSPAKFPAIMSYIQSILIYLHYFGRAEVVGMGLIQITLKNSKTTVKQTHLTLQWTWRDCSPCHVSQSVALCPGRKARRPPGTSSRKTCRNSFGLGSLHAKVTNIHSHVFLKSPFLL